MLRSRRDSQDSIRVQNELVRSALPVVYATASRYAKKFSCPTLDYAEYVGIASEALVNAARRYESLVDDPLHSLFAEETQRHFRAFVKPRIEGAIKDRMRLGARRERIRPTPIPLEHPEEVAGTETVRTREQEVAEVVELMFRVLRRPHLTVALDVLLRQRTLSKIARIRRKRFGTVARVWREAKKTLEHSEAVQRLLKEEE